MATKRKTLQPETLNLTEEERAKLSPLDPNASPDAPLVMVQGLAGNAIRCVLPASGYFPATDARAGHYEPGRLYHAPQDIPQEKAAALVEGGGFVWADAPKEGEQ